MTESLFVFGDSLSDTGNFYGATQQPQSPPYFTGRFSNGPVAVEGLAQQLGFTIAANYAWGGARTGRDNFFDNPQLNLEFPGLLEQIDQFRNSLGTTSADPNAVGIRYTQPPKPTKFLLILFGNKFWKPLPMDLGYLPI